jgi:tetratricopeptide (TPR) repeat protein
MSRLHDAIVHNFRSKSELAILCGAIEQALRNDDIDLPVSPDIVGGEGLPAIAFNLVVYLESKGLLQYLVDQVRIARPNLDLEGAEETDQHTKSFFDRIPPNRHELYGRQAQIDQAVAVLSRRESLLLHGMAGIGKTALAAEVATQLRDSQAFDGVLWVGNVGASTVEGICDAVSRLLKNKRIPKLPLAEKPAATYDLLSTYNLLIVLDDVQDPRVALDFANQCIPPRNALLVTSRQRRAGYNSDLKIRPLEEQASIDMFSGLAQVPPEDASVAKICKLLGYHPLALTVAASLAREEDVSPSSLYRRLSRVGSRAAYLGRGDGSQTNRDVWASLKLSYDALPDPQRHIFTHLAACFGESTGLELLASICELSQDECEDVAGRLVAWSLVERSEDRFSMHSLVKDFGQEVLRREERLQEVQGKVAAELLPYVRRHVADTREDYLMIALELDNLIGLLRVGNDLQLQTHAYNLAALLTALPALDTLGYWTEYLIIGELGIKLSEGVADERLYAQVMHNTAIVHMWQGNYERARELYQQSLDIFRKFRDQRGIAFSLHNLGIIELNQDNYERARELYQQSLDMKRKLGDQGSTASSLHQMGILEQRQGNYEQARELYQQSLDIERKLGNQEGIASSLHQMGILEQKQGNYEQARDLYQQSLDIKRKLGDQVGIALSLGQLGIIASSTGDKSEARRLFQEALVIFEMLGSPYAKLTRQNLAELDSPQ